MDNEVIYAQVLLLDNKIENWKVCQSKKYTPYDFKAYWKHDRMSDYTMETKVFRQEEIEVTDGWSFNSYIYDVLAPEWINQWGYAEDYKLAKTTAKTLEESRGEIESISKMFGGRLEFIGKLGDN